MRSLPCPKTNQSLGKLIRRQVGQYSLDLAGFESGVARDEEDWERASLSLRLAADLTAEKKQSRKAKEHGPLQLRISCSKITIQHSNQPSLPPFHKVK